MIISMISTCLFLSVYRERNREAEKKELEKQYAKDFKVAREEWKRLEKEKLEDENRKIAEFAQLQDKREGDRQMAKKEQEAYRENLLKAVSIGKILINRYLCISMLNSWTKSINRVVT